MSQIFVSEYPDVARMSQSDSTPILPMPPTTEYNVIVSAASSGAAAPIRPTTKFLMVSCDTTCSISIGLFPGVIGTGSAGVTNLRLAPNERITLGVPSSATIGGASTIPQPSAAYAIFTTANV